MSIVGLCLTVTSVVAESLLLQLPLADVAFSLMLKRSGNAGPLQVTVTCEPEGTAGRAQWQQEQRGAVCGRQQHSAAAGVRQECVSQLLSRCGTQALWGVLC
jgi:hypothetical protein